MQGEARLQAEEEDIYEDVYCTLQLVSFSLLPPPTPMPILPPLEDRVTPARGSVVRSRN